MSSENVSDNNVILSEDTKKRDITVTEDITKITQFPFTTPITNSTESHFVSMTSVLQRFWRRIIRLSIYLLHLSRIRSEKHKAQRLVQCALHISHLIGNLSVDFAF